MTTQKHSRQIRKRVEWKFWLVFIVALVLIDFWAMAEMHKPRDKDLAIRDRMVSISRQLGVTCNHCHDITHFKDASKATFKIARAHMSMVKRLNARRIAGLPKVDCYMCHQGHAKFEFAQPAGLGEKAAPSVPAEK